MNAKLIAKPEACKTRRQRQRISIRLNELAIIVERCFQDSRANCVAMKLKYG
jgi:hypothetical protein